ncbi:MAG: carboxypeptidase regulatory-like domain-containing protein [Cellulomonas sp.]|nr:carboxypeptidase regulatory-like domain-containing protein [Cellulomonas sp.]MCR6649847.1 carboxypeptidase regulatory-like domain-containing protein [Cellulomonas sp.]
MRTRIAASIGALVLSLGVLLAPAASAADETYTVTATVTTRGGTPIPYAAIEIRPAGAPEDADPIARQETASDGSAILKGVAVGDYVVTYTEWRQSIPVAATVTVDGHETVSFVDEKLVALSARLVDDETGKAVDDGWVKGRPRVGGYSFLNLIGDADGRGTTFALAGTYDLWTVAGGGSHNYMPTRVGTVTLRVGQDVTGRVYRLVRQPQIKGRVTAGGKGKSVWIHGSPNFSTTSGPNGRFSSYEAPGSYVLHVPGDVGYFTTYSGSTVRRPDAEKIVVRPGRDSVADIALVQRATVTGRVVGRDGRPAKGIAVYAANVDRTGRVNATTDRDGRYTLRGLATGQVSIVAQGGTSSLPAEGKATVWARQGETVAAKQITLMDDAIIYGQVKTTGSSPTKQDVSLSTSSGEFLGTFRPDADGWVGFAALPAGTYYVHVDGANLRRQVVVRAHKTATFGTLTRGELRTVSGKVTDWAGKPVAGASVHVYDQYGTAYATVRTGSTGRYTIRSVVSGSYQVKVTPKASSPLAWGQVALSVRAGKDSVRDVRLGKGATVTGLVVNTKGKPAIGVTVWSQEGHKATTDATGRYTLTGVKPGRQTLKITDPDYVGGYRDATTTVTAKGGATVTAARATVR